MNPDSNYIWFFINSYKFHHTNHLQTLHKIHLVLFVWLATNSRPDSRHSVLFFRFSWLAFPMSSHTSSNILRCPESPIFRHKKSPSPQLLCLQKRWSEVRDQGFEPWTPWLRVRCSTTWANRASLKLYVLSLRQELLYNSSFRNASTFFIFFKKIFFLNYIYNSLKRSTGSLMYIPGKAETALYWHLCIFW